MKEIYHITPINDLREHTEEGTACGCNPRVEEEPEATFVIHNAYDLREYVEDGTVDRIDGVITIDL